MASHHFRIAILGGGIHGISVAREAACRGLSCLLIEQKDFINNTMPGLLVNTSGDLRKLEQLALYSTVRNKREQNRLVTQATTFATQKDYFILPANHLRSATKIRWGTLLLQRISGLRSTTPISAGQRPLNTELPEAHQFRDLVVSESRLTIALAKQASQLGARLVSHATISQCERTTQQWQFQFTDSTSASSDLLINCTGSAANHNLDTLLHSPSRCRVQKVYFNYAVVRKHYPGQHGYVLQASDGQCIYLTPINDEYLQIGPVRNSEQPKTDNWLQPILEEYNRHFKEPLLDSDVLHSHAIEKGLFEDPTDNNNTRLIDILLDLNIGTDRGLAPLLSLFGSHFTQHHAIAVKALNMLKPYTGKTSPTCPVNPPLPGCEFANNAELEQKLCQLCPDLPSSILTRLANTYGSCSIDIGGLYLARNRATQPAEHPTPADKQVIGGTILVAEIEFSIKNEWVTCAEDFLRRAQLIPPPPQSCIDEIDQVIQCLLQA